MFAGIFPTGLVKCSRKQIARVCEYSIGDDINLENSEQEFIIF
jgi:hypothetical protein